MTAAHQVLARVLDATHNITEALVLLARHERERQLSRREQPDEPLRVTPISLHAITGRPRDRPRSNDPHINAAPRRRASETEPRRARLIHRAHRAPQPLKEREHHLRRRAAQPLHTKLTAQRIEHRRDRLRLVNIKPDKTHTL